MFQRSKYALRAMLLDYLLTAKRSELLRKLEQDLEKEEVQEVRNKLYADDKESGAHENTCKIDLFVNH